MLLQRKFRRFTGICGDWGGFHVRQAVFGAYTVLFLHVSHWSDLRLLGEVGSDRPLREVTGGISGEN